MDSQHSRLNICTLLVSCLTFAIGVYNCKTLKHIAEFQAKERDLDECKLSFKENLTQDDFDPLVCPHKSQLSTDVCLAVAPSQQMCSGNHFVEKSENPLLNQKKQERKGSFHIVGKKKLHSGHDNNATEKPISQAYLDEILHVMETKLITEIGEKTEMVHREISEAVEIVKDGVQSSLDSMKDLLDTKLNNFLKQSEDKNIQNAKEILELNRTLKILTDAFEWHTKSAKILAENLTKVSDSISGLYTRMKFIEEKMFDKGTLIAVIMLDNVILLFLVISFCGFRGTNRNVNNIVEIREEQALCKAKHIPASFSPALRVLNQIKSDCDLEKKLCVISFYEETHRLHLLITDSVVRQLDLLPLEFIIRNHETILKIPLVFAYFICIDFNERNVILEVPENGLGDLRLTTVQAVQKIGGKLVVLYLKDPKSKNLDPSKLYNSKLNVSSQQELSSLEQLSRFVSAFDSLSEYQIMHLRKIVSDDLQIHE